MYCKIQCLDIMSFKLCLAFNLGRDRLRKVFCRIYPQATGCSKYFTRYFVTLPLPRYRAGKNLTAEIRTQFTWCKDNHICKDLYETPVTPLFDYFVIGFGSGYSRTSIISPSINSPPAIAWFFCGPQLKIIYIFWLTFFFCHLQVLFFGHLFWKF